MAENLRVSMIQTHIIWEDLNENLGYYGEFVSNDQVKAFGGHYDVKAFNPSFGISYAF